MTTSSVIHSNAFNFMSFMMVGVDPRTGQYTVSVDMPELKSNRLCGPAVPLQLQFNPLNVIDSGFGMGWNLNLSQFTPEDQMLALSSGENFKVTGSGGQPDIKEKKLDTFHFHDEGNETYRVVHKSGLVEILVTGGSSKQRVALPRTIGSPSGHAVSLTYVPFNGGQLLSTVSDAFTTLLRVERDPGGSFVKLHLHPDSGPNGGPLATFEMKLNGDGEVTAIILPTPEKASWRFSYKQVFGRTCLVEVQTPVGGRETIEYFDQGHVFPGAPRDPLPRVNRHRSYPGFGQPMIEVNYSYTDNNFLGHNALQYWDDNGEDNLYNVDHNYDYGSVATLQDGSNTLRTVTRTFNRFHLLTEEVTTQQHCVKRVLTDYHAEDTNFDNQPPQFQLPKTVTTRWELDNDANRLRIEVESTEYDESGNLTRQVQANGICETFSYYPKDGAEGCPPDPEEFVRNQHEHTTYPATSDYGHAATLRNTFTYQLLPPLENATGVGNWLVLAEETLTSSDDNHVAALQYTQRDYYDAPQDPALHGRPKSLSETLNGKTSIIGFSYSTPLSALAGETVDQVVETLTAFDGAAKTRTRQHSLLNGEVLLDYENDTDVQISYVYDVLGRVIEETVAPDTEFAASRQYAYTLTSLDGQQAIQERVDVKGVRVRTKVDGLNRAILEERQDRDGEKPEVYRRTYLAGHDIFGNIVVETDCDWLGTEELALRRLFEFDDWGQQLSVRGPDDVVEYTQTDPIGTLASKGPITRSWRQEPEDPEAEYAIGGVTETGQTLFEKPGRVERFDTQGKSLSVHQYFYDGLGRTAREVDARTNTTLFAYDAFDRLIESTLPGGAVVKRTYAEHSEDDLPTSISVNDIELGTQLFDGVGRKTESVVGGRKQVFSYDPGQTQPSSVTTPSDQLITYDYLPSLGDEPLHRYLPDSLTAQYDYDKKDARLLSCEESGQGLERSYFSTGELKSETCRQSGGDTRSMHYVYSLNGRLLQYTDVLGQIQNYRYDRAGRLEGTDLGALISTLSYDALGRLKEINTREGDRSLATTLHYDALGREIRREFDLNGISQSLEQEYNSVDAVIQRTLKEGDTLLRNETYGYDPRGRLELYTCAGSQLPVDPYGQAITGQVFQFDALDNLTLVRTNSVNGNNLASYSYDTLDPTQLRRITNSDSARYPAEILLDYDADGNLILDEQQRTLTYDALGRLMTVSAPDDGAQSDYHYDPLDRVARGGANDTDQQRFYREGELANQVDGDLARTFMRGADQLLAERHGDGAVLLGTSLQQTVLSEISPGAPANDIVYSAYGHGTGESPISTALGFNGELSEGDTGWQLLGNGYRAFNPALMRFHSPDSLSPFGEGGLNGYMYCKGDPVNHSDPTGHFGLGILSLVLAVAGAGAIVAGTQVEDQTTKSALYIVGGIALFGAAVLGVGRGATQMFGGRKNQYSAKPGWMQQQKSSSEGSAGGSSVNTTTLPRKLQTTTPPGANQKRVHWGPVPGKPEFVMLKKIPEDIRSVKNSGRK
ncbi:RHS repeat-associated core domain-containing protein [Pseudomonas sp. G.S.17]|uniref:RHS repeat domain-containing protein n=1 Tax=Pseudomonas sp. G.S.17 TaxID=3137451 RepID=UPI00311CD0AE